MLWEMTAEQFAAFDTQLYLDTHPGDKTALRMFNQYQKSYMICKDKYESMFGPISADNVSAEHWAWINDPWPWEKEAN